MASTLGIFNLALIGVGLIIAYYASIAIYNVFFHPLRSFPGPLLNRASYLPKTYYLVKGTLPFAVTDWHQKYGPVVRTTPDELAFADPQAWKDIYGHRQAGQEEFPKQMDFYRSVKAIPSSILNSERDEHAHLRRLLSHGFSDRSMREQEPIIGTYVDLLIRRLREASGNGKNALNMREWLNFATFDIIGDLAFGSSFGCLEDSNYHPWVKLITNTVKTATWAMALVNLGLKQLLQLISDSGAFKSRDEHRALVRARLQQRMDLGAERPDLIEGLLRKKDEWNIPMDKLAVNASILTIAGSETTATLLSGAVYLLPRNPEVLAKLTHEVRSTFKNDSEITLTSVGGLSYMLACLNECLRCYPPVAGSLPRSAPKGAVVAGHAIPEGTVVGVYQWAINHREELWTEPWSFQPERFMGDPKFASDQLDAMQPFSLGPRNCIGRNLAYAEMRLILAKIIFNFDMRLAPGSHGWLETQRAYILWDKPELDLYLTPVTQ